MNGLVMVPEAATTVPYAVSCPYSTCAAPAASVTKVTVAVL